MKKWIIVPIVLIALALLVISLWAPGKINLSQSITINCTHGAANRYLVNDSNWFKWWPTNASAHVKAQDEANGFLYKTYTFQPNQKMFDAIGVLISTYDLTINSRIMLIPKHKDSVRIQWNIDYNTGNNFFTRIQRNLQAANLKTHVNAILMQLRQFLEKNETVYGMAIKKTIVKDTLLLSTRKVFTSQPSTENIYSLINKLKTIIQQEGAAETGCPMLNIQRRDSSHYETMVAIPVNKTIKGQNDIVIKHMVPGNILVAEVRGGVYTASTALTQMENYVTDHSYESPAIPFYSLITNRLTETDTTKWVTRINYPVF